ncbi:hypothetical protein [Marilutibacter alkalisoli]|uniref:Uncharacterized protein n=1 Tax=Marilutibacter alkalisoli TaxID=2591633 RepID=A0A514BTV1_9GAMM|nr:hypothetical protein [Lysobacter alkalisoli]QDH70838.1 hypothetical protein FKV23_12665 [Lysobacter alkalisoli]
MDPMTWYYIIMLVVSLAVSYAMRPKTQHAKPPALEDYSVPTVEEGRPVAKIYGTCWIDDPNVLWWGDVRHFPPIKASGGK